MTRAEQSRAEQSRAEQRRGYLRCRTLSGSGCGVAGCMVVHFRGCGMEASGSSTAGPQLSGIHAALAWGSCGRQHACLLEDRAWGLGQKLGDVALGVLECSYVASLHKGRR